MSNKQALERILAKNKKAKLTLEEAALLINASDSELDLSEDEEISVSATYLEDALNEKKENDLIRVDKEKPNDLFDVIMVQDAVVDECPNVDEPGLEENATLLAMATDECADLVIDNNIQFEFIDESRQFQTTDKAKIVWTRRNIEQTRFLFERELCEDELETSPYEIFMKYIPHEMFASMAFFTNLYAQQQNMASFKPTSSNELLKFVGIQILMGTLKMSRIRMYFSKYISIQTIIQAMSHEWFSQLRNAIHFVNNLEKPDNNQDKFFKTRPLINCIRKRCLEHIVEDNISVDEQIIPFQGRLNIKQYIKGKPCPRGIKVFLLCGKSGLPYDFIIYQGSTTEINNMSVQRFGYGAAIVLKLAERIKTTGHVLCFDNYFSSYQLFECLSQLQINAIGTVRLNRFRNPPHLDDKALKKQGRGSSDLVTSRDGNVKVIKWQDNKAVYLASNFIGIGEEVMVRRYDKLNSKFVQIKQPQIVKIYNMGMGGVDLFDQLLSYYRFFHKSRKWTLRVIAHFIDFAVVSSWIEYKNAHKRIGTPSRDIMDLLNFRLYLSHCLTTINQSVTRKRGRPLSKTTDNTCNNVNEKKNYEGISAY